MSATATPPARREGRQADLALLGHELRNPLAAAITGVAAAAAITAVDDPRHDLLARAQRDLERLAGLMSAYLDLLGGRLRHPAEVDVGAVVRATASRRGAAAVVVRATGEPLPVRGNSALLGRALENLIDNALRFGARRVEIAATRTDTEIVVEVSDDGSGVTPELRARVFEPFVSGRGSTGLGLTLVKDIVEAHGGSVGLLPAAAGARFALRLPVLGARETDTCAS